MKTKLIKVVPLVASLLATSGFSAYGSSSQRMDNSDEHQMMSAYSSPARVNVNGSWDMFLEGSFIYWQPKLEGLDFAINPTATPTTSTGRIENMSFKFKPGFKVALGMHFNNDDWDMAARYTWLYMSESSSANALSSSGLTPSWLDTSNSSNVFTTISGRWKLDTNIIDGELGRSYYSGKCLQLRPHFGLRGVIIDHKYTATHTQGATNQKTRSTEDTWGIGPRAGLEAKYMLTNNFYVSSYANFAILYQDFDTKVKQDNENDVTTLFFNIKDDSSNLTPNPEAGLGIGYGTYLGDRGWYANLSAMYDFSVFFNQNQMRQVSDKLNTAGVNSSEGNLFYQGLTITLRFDF